MSYHFVVRGSSIISSISLNIHNAWASLMEVSVPKIPNSWKNKILFPAYVCYFPATVIVFNTFFLYRICQGRDLGRRLRLWTRL